MNQTVELTATRKAVRRYFPERQVTSAVLRAKFPIDPKNCASELGQWPATHVCTTRFDDDASECRVDLPPMNRTTVKFVQSINMENDGLMRRIGFGLDGFQVQGGEGVGLARLFLIWPWHAIDAKPHIGPTRKRQARRFKGEWSLMPLPANPSNTVSPGFVWAAMNRAAASGEIFVG